MKQQTAVNFLYEFVQLKLTHEQQMQFEGLFQQAKQMEKEQIMKAVYDSMGTNFDPNMGRAELYYNETYGKTK
jgi:hypothetical protein